MSDEVETLFWESKAKRSTLSKSKFCCRKVPRKLFWRYLKVKNKCSERLKWVTKLKRFSGKASQSVQDYLNQNLVVGASWKMVLKLPWSQKRILRAFEKSIFQFFADFWVMKLKPVSGKVRQSIESYLNQYLVIGSLLENGFEANFSSKKKCCERLKRACFNFLYVFHWQSWNDFWRKLGKAFKAI